MIIQKTIAMLILLLLPVLTGCTPKAHSQAKASVVSESMGPVQQTSVDEAVSGPEKLAVFPLAGEGCSHDEGTQAYRVGPEDSLAILVYGEKELSGIFTLDNTGTISMPLIGELKLSGCTLRQVEKIIFDKYADGYLVDPSISIEISAFRPFYILGEVKVPGRYDFVAGMNVLKASALAGGFTYRADRKKARVLRYNQEGQAAYHQQRMEDAIQPGDVITIQERLF